MKKHPYIAELIRYPWAILDSYIAPIAGALARLACDEPMTDVARAYIDERRAHWRAVGALSGFDVAPGEAYARASGPTYSGTVAVIGMYGVLSQRGGIDDTSEPMTSMARLAGSVSSAAADPQIGAIVLDVDSPGGSVYGVQELADAIHAARDAKPIAAVCNSLMASAAYWAASQANELYCAPGGEVGSIGVYTMHANVAELMKQRGVSVEMISAGKYKTEGNPYQALTDDARAHIQSSVDQYYDAFVRSVARGRNVSLKAVREGMGQGRTLLPDAAKAEGMIDGVATLGQVIGKMGARAKRAAASARSAMQRDLDILKLG